MGHTTYNPALAHQVACFLLIQDWLRVDSLVV